MRVVGKAFPRSDRSPAIIPVRAAKLAAALAERSDWRLEHGRARQIRVLLQRSDGVRAEMTDKRHPLTKFGMDLLPFADAASDGLPLNRLLRLSLFQISVGMATVLLLGTLNRVMIVELSVPTMLVAAMVALPVLVAPFRAFLGFRSDTHRSAIGWRRVPFIWFGSLYQFGGLAFMPFSLILLSGDQIHGPEWAGEALAGAAFVMTGLGLHMTQTAGLALAADQAEPEKRHRVVALLYVMFLVGMAISALIFGALLRDFSQIRLIQVVQGAAALTLVLNLVALWKQERMNPMSRDERAAPRPRFSDALFDLLGQGRMLRVMTAIALGTAAFSMQDVLLEPYGGEILGLSVAATTTLTAVWALGALVGFALASRRLGGGTAILSASRRTACWPASPPSRPWSSPRRSSPRRFSSPARA